jgi:hypothetical protein
MTNILEGQRFWKHGDHDHVWIVDAVMSGDAERPPFAILMREDGQTVEDVDLSHLENPNIYTPVPEAGAEHAKAG